MPTHPMTGTPSAINLDQTTMLKVMGSGSKSGVNTIYAHILYNGASWEVVATTSSNELVTGNLAWSTNKLTIALSGFTEIPVTLVSQTTNAATPYHVMARATSISNIDVVFFDLASAQVTTEDTDMDFNIVVMGA